MPKSATLLLIRHAEKSGDPDDTGLTPAGEARAQAYAVFFQRMMSGTSRLPPPAFLIAAAIAPDSHRAHSTLEPLAVALGIEIDARVADGDYPTLARRLLEDARYDGATTLVCWTHKKILGLAKALGAPDSLLPKQWPDDTFGWMLRLEYDAAGTLADATLASQRLMFGDCGDEP
ncbi:hypothetical protein LYSHEL_26250 [Lysobacter helvus]|uniref:Histidine phosphatase family protein n=2 Tax=Lysobacteraceae TaxID=32033 RepID=A0ABN6FXE4_9GAMM|nr:MULTISPECIES: flagellar basal body-associated protein FliL [Lysobacter]BCT93600.1 hypothetical protein LYSCAS_26240 [Lysobacter caseinilyticus]BCT96754.1 hypothetical protein LYSHEL_26250 [Lysobacter helvus]